MMMEQDTVTNTTVAPGIGNVIHDFEVEKLSNVPGKFFRRKKWRCRNGLGFVKFIYEGQVAVSRICGRDFFICAKAGSLPHLVFNEEVDVTMEVRRLKRPGFWPQLETVGIDADSDELLSGTEFVSPAAWTGVRPEESVLAKHVSNSELDMFRLPKEMAIKMQQKKQSVADQLIRSCSDSAGTPGDIIISSIAEEDKSTTISTNKDCFPLPKEAIYFNQTAILTKFISNFLIQLELIESPTTEGSLVGKPIFASRNRFYASNGLALKAKETFDNYLRPGQQLYCDIAPQQADDSWVATVAWIGSLETKPNVEALHWHHELNRSAQRGKLLSLDYHPDLGANGGLIYNVDTGERAVFSRDQVFLFGTCLAKMDLSYVLSSSDKVKLVTEPINDSQKLMECKEKYGGLEVYRRAKLVWVGETPKYYQSPDDQSKFVVDKKLNGLCQYLNKRNVSIDTFADELVTGVIGKMPGEGGGACNKVPLAAASLMAASDLRGQLVELKRPDCGQLKKDTVNGILQISSGEYAGQLAFFPRHSLHIFGHNMHKSNLMDVVSYKEEFQVELIGGTNNKSIPFTVRSAWIGPRPSSVVSKENATTSMSDNQAFKSWLSKHKLSESEFLDCVKGQRPAKPFFPIQTSNIFPAKVLVLESNPGQAVQAGILVITKGPLENQLCIFEANSVFLHTVHFMHGDLSYIFKENVEKVTVETTEFSGGKERKKMYAKVKSCLERLSSMPPPAHYAQLVYVGSRPKATNCCLNEPLSELQVQHTPNLKLWLGKRNLTCLFFSSLIKGLIPPRTVTMNCNGAAATENEKKMDLSNQTIELEQEVVEQKPMIVQEGPPNVSQEVVKETMGLTHALLSRVMKCTSPDDPSVQHVITGNEDLALALFISKTLSKAVMHYTASGNNLASWSSSSSSNHIKPPQPIAPPRLLSSRTHEEADHQSTAALASSADFQSQPIGNNHGMSDTIPNATSHYEPRGLTGLRQPLLNYEPRQRRRSGEHFNNSWIEPPFKLCKASNHFR